MKIDVDVRFGPDQGIEAKLAHMQKQLHVILTQGVAIMTTQAEQAVALNALADQVDKIIVEIQALETALATAGNSTPEVDAAVARLKASIQGADDLSPDAVVV